MQRLYAVVVFCFFSLMPKAGRAQQITSAVYFGPVNSVSDAACNSELQSPTAYHQLKWTNTGSVTACTVLLDDCNGNVIVAAQDCSANGTSPIVNSVVAGVRVRVTAFTGTGATWISYSGYSTNPGGGGGGSGTVTSVSAGNFSPLFTSSVANASTTPAVSFAALSQIANQIFASPNGSSGNPGFRALVSADLPAGTGTVTSVSTGNLSPLFTASIANPTSTPALSFAQVSQAANQFYGAPNGSSGVPVFRAIAGADEPATTVQTNQANTYSAGTQDFSAVAALVPTRTAGDSTTNSASTAFVSTAVNNAIAGVNPAVAVQAGTPGAVLPNSPTYNNGASGIGATLTAGVTNTALVVDGYTPALNDRVLVKDQATAAQNGVYTVTQLAGVGLAWILTRALDYDQASDMNNTGAIPIVNGTVNAQTQWVQTSKVTTVGTDAVTFTQFSGNPANAVTASANFTNGDLVQAAGNNKTASDSGIATGNVVTAAANYTNGDLVQAAGANKTTSDSGVVAANVVTATSAAAGAKQVCTSSGASKTCSYIDFPDVKTIPAANCNNATAGNGWSIGSGGTVTCRAGTNNQGGYVAITDTSSTFAQFAVEIPEDWDSGTNPYIRFQVASTDATSGHTIIPQIKVSCAKGDGTTTDDVSFNAAHSSSTITLNTTANQFWSNSTVQMNSTDMTGCVAGALMIVQVGRATDTATNAEFYAAVITFPRLLVVQGN